MNRGLPILFALALVVAGAWLYLGRAREPRVTEGARDPGSIRAGDNATVTPRARPPGELDDEPLPPREAQVAPPALQELAKATRVRVVEQLAACELPKGTPVELRLRLLLEKGTMKVLKATVTGPDGELDACARTLLSRTWAQEGADQSFSLVEKVEAQ